MKYLFLTLLFLTSCATVPSAQFYERTIPIDESSLAWVLEAGNTKINGNSFISDNLAINPGLHTCAGYEVNLIPVNEYFEEISGLTLTKTTIDSSVQLLVDVDDTAKNETYVFYLYGALTQHSEVNAFSDEPIIIEVIYIN